VISSPLLLATVPSAACAGCGRRVDTRANGVAEAVTGWRVNRAQGGANQITLPRSLGRWLCPYCLSVARGKTDLDQGELF
jgi:hypothetical protein